MIVVTAGELSGKSSASRGSGWSSENADAGREWGVGLSWVMCSESCRAPRLVWHISTGVHANESRVMGTGNGYDECGVGSQVDAHVGEHSGSLW